MPEVAGLTAEKVRKAKTALDGQAAYLELAKHFRYDISFLPRGFTTDFTEPCWLVTLKGKLQDKEQTDWLVAEYIKEASQFDKSVESLEGAMRRRYIEIAHRDE
jgi:hypothetical protein